MNRIRRWWRHLRLMLTVTDLEDRIAWLEHELLKTNDRVDTLDDHTDNMQFEINDLTEGMSSVDAKIEELNSRCDDLDYELQSETDQRVDNDRDLENAIGYMKDEIQDDIVVLEDFAKNNLKFIEALQSAVMF